MRKALRRFHSSGLAPSRSWTLAAVTSTVLRRQCRIAVGRKPEPTAAIIDSQSVKAAETVARPGRGYDAGNYQGSDVMPGLTDRGWLMVAWWLN